ncbi:MAG: LLM class flavin-dependent oxidoreductase [bacterium]|nr:LLM class flavin-dependent oxidoreductase [bacterium]
MKMKFGCLGLPGKEFPGHVAQMEKGGFDYAWLVDSPVGFGAMETSLSLAAAATSQIKLGALVTNPVLRHDVVTAAFHAALNELSGGRALLGLGRGDSALRRLGERPATLREFKEAALRIKSLASGGEIKYVPEERAEAEDWYAQSEGDSVPVGFPWVELETPIPLFVAAYGPLLLNWAGRHADGVILQVADLDTVKWCMDHVRAGAAEVGRDLSGFEFVCGAPIALATSAAEGARMVKSFAAVLSNHTAAMVAKLPKENAPKNLLRLLEAKPKYDYRDHGRPGAEHADYISEELSAMMAIAGTAADCIAKIQKLGELGVTQIAVYPNVAMSDLIDSLSEKIIPAFQ